MTSGLHAILTGPPHFRSHTAIPGHVARKHRFMLDAMVSINKRKFLYVLGTGVVLFWLVMVGLLVRKTHFSGNDRPAGIPVASESTFRPQHDWMAIYLKGKKVGFSETRVSPLGQDRLVEEKMVLALNLMGQPSVMHMATRAVLDKGFVLKAFLMTLDSGVVLLSRTGKG